MTEPRDGNDLEGPDERERESGREWPGREARQGPVEVEAPAPDAPGDEEEEEGILEPEAEAAPEEWEEPEELDEAEEPDEADEPDEGDWPDEEHAAGELEIPDAVDLLEGEARGGRRRVGVVVSRFNGEVTNRLLRRALLELEDSGVPASLVTVMPVPGAFELPLGAMALAKTRRFACVVALGCVVRGETPHFDYVAGEAASGLQLAALETGVPVSFGVLTVESIAQAEARLDRARDAVRSALEMADVFAQVRSASSGG